jgi:probable DNA metabolism protein
VSLYLYDGSFEGLLTAIFECYADRCQPTDIRNQALYQASLLDDLRVIVTDATKAERVLNGIDARSDHQGAELVYHLFLSELAGIELHIYQLVRVLVDQNDPGILDNFANPHILYSAQVNKMISREVHRMHAFVRFQKSDEGIYYAIINPDFNVLPLIGDHFHRRFADQPWVIFDSRRHYGLYCDLHKMIFIDADAPILINAADKLQLTAADEKENNYQQLWKSYFQSVNIKERQNLKLHLRHVPRRYWKYLIEKQAGGVSAGK